MRSFLRERRWMHGGSIVPLRTGGRAMFAGEMQYRCRLRRGPAMHELGYDNGLHIPWVCLHNAARYVQRGQGLQQSNAVQLLRGTTRRASRMPTGRLRHWKAVPRGWGSANGER